MPTVIPHPSRIRAAGTREKLIDEYIAVCLPAFSPDTVRRDPA